MTVVAITEAVALVAVVIVFLVYTRAREREAAEERRVLADRIQRPEVLPLTRTAFTEPPRREDDQLNMVGKIRISETYGVDDGR